MIFNQRTISPLENSSESQRLPIAPISFTIIFLQFRKKIFPSGDFHSNENHRLLGKPFISIQDSNTNFHLEPKNRKAEIIYRIQCDVGANKNAGQAFSMPRLSSHFILYQISAFRLFLLTIRI